MRDTRQTPPTNSHPRTGRSFRFPLILVLCACFLLTAGQAVARPPRDSDTKFFDDTIGDKSAPRGNCPVAVGGYKVIRRDSFQAVYMGYEDSDCGNAGAGYAAFRLPSGKTATLVCDDESARKWYGGKRGRLITVHYEMARLWPYGGYCVQRPVCAAPRKGRR